MEITSLTFIHELIIIENSAGVYVCKGCAPCVYTLKVCTLSANAISMSPECVEIRLFLYFEANDLRFSVPTYYDK